MNNLISVAPLYGGALAHSGIKGMKWGLRRYQNPDGTLTEEGRRRYRRNHPDYNRAHTKDVRDMSDEELRVAVQRINNERIYTSVNKKKSKEPLEYINKFTKYAGGITAASAAATALYKVGKNRSQEIFDLVGNKILEELNQNLV